MARKRAQVKEGMTYREGDGPQMPIPPGPCEIEIGAQDVMISWKDGETHGVAAIPMGDYQQRVKDGVLVVG